MTHYFIGMLISNIEYKKIPFYFGVIFNVGLIAYFKYTDFIITNINSVFGANVPLQEIVLPLGISFFTFQQISYIADIYTGKHDPTGEGFINYCCYICFFPQLIAGPIVHHHEMMPQFYASQSHKIDWENIYNGMILLSIGLAKKVIVADNLSPIVGECFDTMQALSFLEASFASLAYTLQLYFDFSGYCDIAIACALFFNIKLPINFNSPYKSKSIQEFWRRWHITLSRWLRDYLYIPLGGNRKGERRTYANLLATFLIGGLWHGAAWTFVVWGMLHGLALIVNRLWSKLNICKLPGIVALVLTFLFVNMAWICFRCQSFAHVKKFVVAFMAQNGYAVSSRFMVTMVKNSIFVDFTHIYLYMCILLLVIFFAKNSLQMLDYPKKFLSCMAVCFYAVIFILVLLPENYSEFIYSQF